MNGFLINALILTAMASPVNKEDVPPTHLVEQFPSEISEVAPGVFLVDFGREAFGNILLMPKASNLQEKVTVRFGEALKNGRVDAHPPGTVRYYQVTASLHGQKSIVIAPPADKRNTSFPAVLTPKSWGVLAPYRWVEVEGWPTKLQISQIRRRAAFDSTWSDDAAAFESSDPMLNQVWDLCHYSIKATTFAGIFVDGDRERLAYEGDAFLNQLGYYAGDADPRMPRATFDHLMRYPTWPSEWSLQMVFMAYADWMQTGDIAWLKAHYDQLKTKLLSDRLGEDGLITSSSAQIAHGDLVDWPPAERDGYVFTNVNTVVNAFHIRALQEMSRLAHALGKNEDERQFSEQERQAEAQFQKKFFDPVRGLYRDGEGTDHVSLHANLFPLAFGLVPENVAPKVARWLSGRGMAASVYAAQYLLEGLFENGEDSAALDLMTAGGDRSWRHMVESGATITWEAWDQKYKPNQDWNHVWGAAPANLLPRFVLGAQPLTPGWDTALIQPHPGHLLSAKGKIPTPHGELVVSWRHDQGFTLDLVIPPNMSAEVRLPALQASGEIWSGGKRLAAYRRGPWWVLEKKVSGAVEIEER